MKTAQMSTHHVSSKPVFKHHGYQLDTLLTSLLVDTNDECNNKSIDNSKNNNNDNTNTNESMDARDQFLRRVGKIIVITGRSKQERATTETLLHQYSNKNCNNNNNNNESNNSNTSSHLNRPVLQFKDKRSFHMSTSDRD